MGLIEVVIHQWRKIIFRMKCQELGSIKWKIKTSSSGPEKTNYFHDFPKHNRSIELSKNAISSYVTEN